MPKMSADGMEIEASNANTGPIHCYIDCYEEKKQEEGDEAVVREFAGSVPVNNAFLAFSPMIRNSLHQLHVNEKGYRYIKTHIPLWTVRMMAEYSDLYQTPEKAPNYTEIDWIREGNLGSLDSIHQNLITACPTLDDVYCLKSNCEKLGHNHMAAYCTALMVLHCVYADVAQGKIDVMNFVAENPTSSGDVKPVVDMGDKMSVASGSKRRIVSIKNDDD